MKVIDVAAGLVFRHQKLLITQRPEGTHLAGLWELPGGKRDPHESFEGCLQRELMEELGIEVDVGRLLFEITHPYPEKTVHLKFFRCSWRRHEPKALGCAAFEWVAQCELKQYRFPAADDQLITLLQAPGALWDKATATPRSGKGGRSRGP